MTGFDAELGRTQGRIAPVGWIPPNGTQAFVLGRDLVAQKRQFKIGDYVEVTQLADFAGIKILRMSLRLRPPAAATVGAQWKLRLIIDATEYASQLLVPGRTRDRRDVAANVSKLAAGNHTVRLRLELVAA